MSIGWWILSYAIIGGFLAWVAFGRALSTLIGGAAADLFVEGSEPQSDRTIRRIAVVLFVLVTAWFIVGLLVPALRI